MSILDIIYRILIGPLELFFEVVFVVANRLVENPAYAIIILSLAMNVLVLPLYRRADELQAQERDKEAELKPWVKHIKKTFKGNERFMMLQTFYRQNDYKPTDALKGSVSLLLEIPFFIAAYHFLSHLSVLQGVSFGPISDLGAPDGLIQWGGTTINFLPILMTLINVISAAIYMKGFPFRSKIQMYGIAVIFLVLLYRSPAGLVFYWTLNNIFSLGKNVFYKIPNPAGVLRVLLSIIGILLILGLYFVHPMRSLRSQAILTMILLTMQGPMVGYLFHKTGKEFSLGESPNTKSVFCSSSIILTVLTGLLIPSAIVRDSTLEFINPQAYMSPLWLIVSTLTIAFGTFIIWFGIFYNLAGDSGKPLMALFTSVAAIGGMVDYFFYGKTFGNLSPDLVFDDTPHVSREMILKNTAVLLAVALVVLLLFIKKRTLVSVFVATSCVVLAVMSGMNIVGIQQELKASEDIIATAIGAQPQINLSKNGKNVIVIMMDRQIGRFVPYITHEKPELKKQFDGFTFYPNSVSFGSRTVSGSPALYGGYDYTTEMLNKRDNQSMESKQNEALKVMPTVFGDAGYDVTICEPTYAGYSWIPDLTIFNDHPEYRCFLANQGFTLEEYGYGTDPYVAREKRLRNFFCFSLYRIAPAICQTTLYEHGNYNASARSIALNEGMNISFPQVESGMSKASGYREDFMGTYAVLCHLDDITKINKSDTNTFFMMSNDTAHNHMLLQEPAYEPAPVVDNTEFDAAHPYREDGKGNRLKTQDERTLIHYQVNMAAMIRLGQWFDYLREQGVWDNTRIIIVSDHAQVLYSKQYKTDTDKDYVLSFTRDSNGKNYTIDMMVFNSVLLYKDFNSTGFTTDDRLTTNADTPALATKDLIPNATNPFTGNKLTTYQEKPIELNLLFSNKWKTEQNSGNRLSEGYWFNVHDNIYDIKNWTYKGYY